MSLRPVNFLREVVSLVLLVLVGLAVATPAVAEKGKLRERLTPEVMAVVFPGAERLGPEEGTPPAIAAYKDGKVAAYIFSTLAGVDLFGANFHGADLRGVSFEGANLKNAIMTDAQTEGTNFDAAIMPDGKRNE